MDETQAWDREDLGIQRRLGTGKNLVLAGFADCAELREIRAGRRRMLSAFGYVKSNLPSMGGEPLDDIANELFIPELARVLEQRGLLMMGEMQEALERKLADVRPGLRNGEIRELGLAYKNKEALGILTVVRMQVGTDTVVRYGVAGMTVVRGIPLAVNIFRQAEDDSVVPGIAAESEETMRRLVRSNP